MQIARKPWYNRGMIYDNIKNYRNYLGINDSIDIALNSLVRTNFESLAPGKYQISDDKIYALVQEYETKTKTALEVHRKYIDIAYMISGEEKVLFSDILNCTNSHGYDDETDAEFFGETFLPAQQINMREGDFLIFFPNDGHAYTKENVSTFIKKVVIKVALN